MNILITIFFILILGFLTSKLKINVQSIEKEKNDLKIKFNINFGFYLFGIIKILGISLQENGIDCLGIHFSYSKIKLEKDSLEIFKEFSVFQLLKYLHPKLEKLNLKLTIGTEDVILTAVLVFISSTFLSIVGAKNRKQINSKQYSYQINPVYNKNQLSFQIASKVSVKMVDLIKTISYIKKNKKKKINSPTIKKIPLKI